MTIPRRTFLTLTTAVAGALALPTREALAEPRWLDCFLPDSGLVSACYDKEPGATALVLGDRGEVIHGVRPKGPTVECFQVECSDHYLEDAAGMMLQMAAEDTTADAAQAFFGGGYRTVRGYGNERRLRVAHPWHVGRFCTFTNGKRGLILVNPAAVTFA